MFSYPTVVGAHSLHCNADHSAGQPWVPCQGSAAHDLPFQGQVTTYTKNEETGAMAV